MLLLGDLPLRGAAQLETKERCCFWGSSRCAGLLDYRERDTASGGASAARGCSMEGEGRLFLGEIQLREGGGACNRGPPAARGCWIRERKMRLLGELPPPAARGCSIVEMKGRGCFWGKLHQYNSKKSSGSLRLPPALPVLVGPRRRDADAPGTVRQNILLCTFMYVMYPPRPVSPKTQVRARSHLLTNRLLIYCRIFHCHSRITCPRSSWSGRCAESYGSPSTCTNTYE